MLKPSHMLTELVTTYLWRRGQGRFRGTKLGVSKLVGVYKSSNENDALHPTRPHP